MLLTGLQIISVHLKIDLENSAFPNIGLLAMAVEWVVAKLGIYLLNH